MSTVQGSKTPRGIQLMQWALDPTGYMETNQRRYGDFFVAPVSPVDDDAFVFVNHPEALQFKPGTLMMGCIYLIHQHPDVYKAPKDFNPDRFLEHTYSPYEFIPFGNGARRCVGSALAQMELKLVLSTLLTTTSLELVNKKPVKPQRRGVTLGSSPVTLMCKE